MEPQARLDTYTDKLRELQRSMEIDESKNRFVTSFGRNRLSTVFRELRRSSYLLKYTKPFQTLFREINEFLQTVSVVKNNLPAEGNSAIFLKKLVTIEKYSKLETKIKHTIIILTQIKMEPLIFNSQISQHIEEQKSKRRNDHKAILTNLEQVFRNFIKDELTKTSSDWWNTKIPTGIRQKAEKTRARDKNLANQYAKKPHVIDYVDFIDYAKIITSDDNWNVFKKVFSDKSTLLVKFNELKPIRDAIMHSRNVSSSQIQRLKLYSNDLITLIQK